MSDRFDDDLPHVLTLEWVAYRYRDIHRRVRELEAKDARYDPAIQDLLLRDLIKKVEKVQRALYQLLFAVVAASLTAIFTVLVLLGNRP